MAMMSPRRTSRSFLIGWLILLTGPLTSFQASHIVTEADLSLLSGVRRMAISFIKDGETTALAMIPYLSVRCTAALMQSLAPRRRTLSVTEDER